MDRAPSFLHNNGDRMEPALEITMQYLANTIRASKKWGAQVVIFCNLSKRQIEIINGAGYSTLEKDDCTFVFLENVPRGTLH